MTLAVPPHRIKDAGLSGEGEESIALARREMPGLVEIERRYREERPLEGARIVGCLHMTIQTAVMVEVLVSLGAEVSWCSSNALSTEDRAAAALAAKGISVYAWKGETAEEYQWCLEAALHRFPEGPSIIIDDGGDLTDLVHRKYPDLVERVIGLTEQTTTGTHRLKAMEARGALRLPAICVNESVMKTKFDNLYGCRESLLDGIKRATDVMIAGKKVHVCGYGDVGKGCAQSMARMGAAVSVSEIDPICAMQAAMEGFRVARVEDVKRDTDIFVTATGNCGVIMEQDIVDMKDYVVLCNIGHFNVEIDADWIYRNATEKRKVGPGAERIRLGSGKNVVLLAEGRLVNLGCATGHSSFVMSTSFSCQIMAVLRLWRERSAFLREGRGRVWYLTKEEDEEIARMHLAGLGGKLTPLTGEQALYLGVQKSGPYKDASYKY